MEKKTIEEFAKYGIDPFQAEKTLEEVAISLPCWQLDDVHGFESHEALSGGIASTGNYPYRARDFQELASDMDMALSLIPGKKKINVHASYQTEDPVDRSKVSIKNYQSWIEFAKKEKMGLDFNPTIFSSRHLKNGLSLSSYDEGTRDYWIKHCINCLRISEELARNTGERCLCNIWIPDGLKETPSDRLTPRKNLLDSLNKIFLAGYDRSLIDVSLESKVFGIGLESYTVGSNEFYLLAASKFNAICLLDMGHFHPTENVADKIASLLCYFPKIAMHLSRPVRWDSDHVVKLNDDLQEVTDELVRNHALDKTYLALDYFDASINRVSALVIGARNVEKALLRSLLTPWGLLQAAQKDGSHDLLYFEEEIKSLPWGEVWNDYCEKRGVPRDGEWHKDIERYEKKVMSKRGN